MRSIGAFVGLESVMILCCQRATSQKLLFSVRTSIQIKMGRTKGASEKYASSTRTGLN